MTNIRCRKCKTERDISLFSWMSAKSRPLRPVGVCDICLGLRPEPVIEQEHEEEPVSDVLPDSSL